MLLRRVQRLDSVLKFDIDDHPMFFFSFHDSENYNQCVQNVELSTYHIFFYSLFGSSAAIFGLSSGGP